VNKQLDAIEKHRTVRFADYDKAMNSVLSKVMDAVIAEMGGDDENSKM